MPSMSVSDATAGFASLVDEAATAELLATTRHKEPAAMLVSVEAGESAKRAMAKPRPDFGEFLMSYPGPSDLERNSSSLRDVELE